MGLLAQPMLVAAGAYSRLAPTERGGYHLARFVRRFVAPDKWRGRFTTPDAFVLDLDLATYPDCCMAIGVYERDTHRQLRKLLKRGSWFVDGGANIGYFSTLAGHWVGKIGRVDAFEPDPQNCERLRTNVDFNGVGQRVRVHNLALSDQSQTLQMHRPSAEGTNHGMAGVHAQGEPFEAKAVRLDQFLSSEKRIPDVIKLDVEGSELIALRGMTRLLQAPQPPVLVIEHNPESCRAAGHLPSDLWRTLTDIRPAYRVYWIGWKLHRLSLPGQLDRITRVGNLLARVGDGLPEIPPPTRRPKADRMATWWRNWME
ncbi:MAG TPA: FkbM family methyltransferase [Tepidisphaeraceae bacterium]|nr:FkbM family methyltransferase [Tepidisphaeraceae bacterium]